MTEMNYRTTLYLKTSFLSLLLFCSIILSVALAAEEKRYAPYPEPDAGYVTDYAYLLSREDQERVETWLWQIESKAGVEIIVVIIDSIKDYPGTDNGSIETFAAGLFNTYGIGNKPANNGVLFLVTFRDRKARIELGAGYGHGRDYDARQIMDNVIVPAFKKREYSTGIQDGVKAIAREFANVRIGFPWHILLLALGVPVLLLVGISLIKNGKRGWGWAVVGLAAVLLLLVVYLVLQALKHMPRSSSDSWSSGGIGGFGGGSSGGGGATGSW